MFVFVTKRLVLMGLIANVFSLFVYSQELRPPTDAEIRESLVYDAIDEMIERRDDLLKQFAVVLQGEVLVVGDGPVPISTGPTVLARVVSKKRSFDLRARYTVVNGNHESGREVVRQGGRYKDRTDKLLVGNYSEKPKDKKLATWLKNGSNPGGLDPFDDYVGGSAAIERSEGLHYLEQGLLGKETLVRTERGLHDQLISHWTRTGPSVTTATSITFDPAYEMMPVKRLTKIKEVKDHFEQVDIEWKRHKKTWVPSRIAFSESDLSDPEVRYSTTYKCYWLIGDEVPSEIFSSDDHLATLLDHFGITHSLKLGGQVIRVPHELPEDLYRKGELIERKSN